ncbi:contactin-associated protein 1-like [Orbicella faveolata]|uniref:contactin-associated protein 1-like n=1 Tax=Orbicella faveolata TaxID=48498 RepID=UPI0009E37953|nr:contactin-associated protein 1-like [Orbicella faveolata]
MNTSGFRTCVKELYATRYDPVSVSYSVVTDICDPGWSYFNGYCYFTSVRCTNWTTAVQKCRQVDSVLVDVSSNEENVYLQHRHNGVKSWLGLNDRTIEGNFTWEDQGEGNFTAWAKNQPNNFRGEDCVHALGVEYSYEWNDVQCSDCHPYTCKKDLNECDRKTNDCHQHASCTNERGSYSCKCKQGYSGDGFRCKSMRSCSLIRKNLSSVSGNYVTDPDGPGGLAPFTVYCDMSDKNGVGVTVISHDSESRTRVKGTNNYLRDIHYTGASFSQLASLTRVSSHCEQFIKYECHHSTMSLGSVAWWMSRDSTKMTYWGGASPGSGKCACGMTNSCADRSDGCNCDKNDPVWRKDSGLLTDKTHLPVKQLRFGDTGGSIEEGYHTLGKLKCYGIA